MHSTTQHPGNLQSEPVFQFSSNALWTAICYWASWSFLAFYPLLIFQCSMATSSTLGCCNLISCIIFVVFFHITLTFLLKRVKSALENKQSNVPLNSESVICRWTTFSVYLKNKTKVKMNKYSQFIAPFYRIPFISVWVYKYTCIYTYIQLHIQAPAQMCKCMCTYLHTYTHTHIPHAWRILPI